MQEARFHAAFEALADGDRTTIVLVTRPDRAALREADRTSGELEALEIRNQQLVINAVFKARDKEDRVAAALEERGQAALLELPTRLRRLPSLRVPLRAAYPRCRRSRR
jgi:arsenite-transporting ATPase